MLVKSRLFLSMNIHKKLSLTTVMQSGLEYQTTNQIIFSWKLSENSIAGVLDLCGKPTP